MNTDGKVHVRGLGFDWVQKSDPSGRNYISNSNRFPPRWRYSYFVCVCVRFTRFLRSRSESWDANGYAYELTSEQPLPLDQVTTLSVLIRGNVGEIHFDSLLESKARMVDEEKSVMHNDASFMLGSRHSMGSNLKKKAVGADFFPGYINGYILSTCERIDTGFHKVISEPE